LPTASFWTRRVKHNGRYLCHSAGKASELAIERIASVIFERQSVIIDTCAI
jgi:hypothetical protein